MKWSSILLLINRQIKEQSRVYLVAIALLFCLLSFMFLLVYHWRDSFTGAVENGVFLIGLFLSGGLFTNSMLREFSSSPEGIWLLNIPATQLEKVVSAILLSTLVFLTIYLGVFFVVDTLYLGLTGQTSDSSFWQMFNNGFYKFIFIYLIFNGIILIGRISFTKYSFLKTMLVIIVGVVFLGTINNALLELYIPNLSVTSSMPLSSFQFRQSGENIHVSLPENFQNMVSACTFTITPLFLWTIAWLKIKEKEI